MKKKVLTGCTGEYRVYKEIDDEQGKQDVPGNTGCTKEYRVCRGIQAVGE